MKRESWEVRELRKGDMIRVNTGRFYHVGIYIGDETVIHFAGEDFATLTDPDSARVRQSSLEAFSMNRPIEVRTYSISERLHKHKAGSIVEEAKKHLGEGGYDIIHNNCEHFANFCVFGIPLSPQIEAMREGLPKE